MRAAPHPPRTWLRRLRWPLAALLVLFLVAPVLLHFSIPWLARLEPEAVRVPELPGEQREPGLTRLGRAYALERGALLEVGLRGTPEEIGYSHTRLLRTRMLENEGILLDRFADAVPSSLLRMLLMDIAQLRYRAVDRGMSHERRRELAAGALGFQPDPYAHFLPTYRRFAYLNALYDIALSFEHSPLVGCTSFAFHGAAKPEGGVLLARAFDMEVDAVFDRGKAVFLVHEQGRVPFASVAWPGLVGVVSGMNAEGVAVVVHGGRAGEPQTRGEPVVHALRRVLGSARSTSDAVRLLAAGKPLVSHIVIVADAAGDVASVERVPGRADTVRRLGERAAVTNHFEGGSRDDPKNRRVERETSTLVRRARADELAAGVRAPADAEQALALLRDRRAPGGTPLPLGDRRAIDALIATHGVIFDTRSKTLWVSEAPHLLGRFVAFELTELLAGDYVPAPGPLPSLPADPLAAAGIVTTP